MDKKVINPGYYDKSVHVSGRMWIVAALLVMLAVPVVIGLENQAAPDWMVVLRGLLAVAPIYWTVCAIEVFTFAPMIGAGGTYIGFVTGNLTGIKIPAALNAMEGAKVKPGTKEGEIISTISIATSSIVTTLIVVVGVLLFTQLKPFLNAPELRPAFNMILPALFGGLGVAFVSKNWKIAIAPVLLMLVLFIFVPALDSGTVGIMVPVSVLFTIAVSRILYKRGVL